MCRKKKKNGLQKIFWHHTHPLCYFSLFFCELLSPFVNEILFEWPLEAHLKPCQKPVKRGYQARKHIKYLRTASIKICEHAKTQNKQAC